MTAEQATRPENKIAGAPISWGVCEVPGWGYQLGPDRVLKEMREVGLIATELGPDGFLPREPAAMAECVVPPWVAGYWRVHTFALARARQRPSS